MIRTFTGPMFSGKTTALLTTYFNMWNKKGILTFKPKMDTRDDGIKSRNFEENISAIEIEDLSEIEKYLKKSTKTIFILRLFFKEYIIDSIVFSYIVILLYIPL